jgi:hypothetical protein
MRRARLCLLPAGVKNLEELGTVLIGILLCASVVNFSWPMFNHRDTEKTELGHL